MAKQLIAWLLLLPWLCWASAADSGMVNRLSQHPSPYLALHGSDPVAWQEWNAETIARAKRENKLLYVSVGYFACHWCHVMQRESYKNPEIAAFLNRDFIPVKVDRELNTGLDDTLQTFSERLLGVAGWPLNAFVTPEGYPVYVMLYAPPNEFKAVLNQLGERWKAGSARITKLARQAAVEPPAPLRQQLDRRAIQQWEGAFLKQARAQWDAFRGGFGQVSKFPMSPQLGLLLDFMGSTPNEELASFLRLTFDQMSAKGLHDHVGGGFFRYTVDPGWETPHFEKMLYDNAQLALLYLRAAELFKSPRYRQAAFGAIDFMLEELHDPDGGFYTSTSAVDAQGREGAVYLWELETLQKLLTAQELGFATRVWRLGSPQPFEFGYLPAEWETPTEPERESLASAMTKLKKFRSGRSLPKDDKRNTGLNGLALMALNAAMKQSPQYAKPAADLVRFISSRLSTPNGLLKAVAKGKQIRGAELEDYAYVVTALLGYAEATNDQAARQLASRLTQQAWKQFFSKKGWHREARPLLATTQTETVLPDGATPSPSAMLIEASFRMNDALLMRKARQALQWQSADMDRSPFVYPTQIQVYRRLIN